MTIKTPTGGGPPEQSKPTKKVASADQAPEVGLTLSVPLEALKKVDIITPEDRPKPVELEKPEIDALSNTVVYEFKNMRGQKEKDKASGTATPLKFTDFQEEFYSLFEDFVRKQDPPIDYSKSGALEDIARKYIEQTDDEMMRGRVIEMVLKLGQLEEVTFQAATGGIITDKDIKKQGYDKVPILDKVADVILNEDEIEPVIEYSKTPRFGVEWTVRGRKIAPFGKDTKKNKIPKKLRVDGITNMDMNPSGGTTPNTLLDQGQINFLTACGFKTGALTDAQIKSIKGRMLAVVGLQRRIYAKTGFDDISVSDLNFVKQTPGGGLSGRNYIDTRKARLLGETEVTTALNLKNILEADGVQITTEVKKKIQDQLDKVQLESARIDKEENTPTRIDKVIEKLKKEKVPSAERQEGMKKIIQYQIDQLKKRLEYFDKEKILPAEIDVADNTLKAVGEEISALNTSIVVDGEASVDLLAWAGLDPTKITESVGSLQNELKLLKSQDAMQQEIDLLKGTLLDLKDFKPTEGDLDKDIAAEVIKISQRMQELAKKRSSENLMVGTVDKGKPVTILISELELKINRRQTKVTENSEKINAYRTAKAKSEEWKGKKTSNDAIIADIRSHGIKFGDFDFSTVKTEDGIDGEIKKLQEHMANVDKGEAEVQLDIQALTVLKDTFGRTNVDARKDRIAEAARGKLTFSITADGFWDKIPEQVTRAAQLIWGKEITLAPTEANKDKIAQVKALLTSVRFLNIIVNGIDNHGTHLNEATNIKDGAYIDIEKVFTGSRINTNTFSGIDKNGDKIENIIEMMRIEATDEITK